MALRHFMCKGSYSNIESVHYSKQSRLVVVRLSVFSDESKKARLNGAELILDGGVQVQRLVAKKTRTLPTSGTEGECYLLANDLAVDHPHYQQRGRVAIWQEINWNFVRPDYAGVMLDAQSDAYVVISHDGSVLTEQPNFFAARDFDRHFAVDKIGGANGDILAACYRYLLTRPEFSGCVEA